MRIGALLILHANIVDLPCNVHCFVRHAKLPRHDTRATKQVRAGQPQQDQP